MGHYANLWMKQKGSDYRIKTAKILNCWRKNHCISKTSKKLNISQPTIKHHLTLSKAYNKTKLNYNARLGTKDIRIQLTEKGSFIRNKVAKILKEYKKHKNIRTVSQNCKTERHVASNFLKLSKFYKPLLKSRIEKEMGEKNSQRRRDLALVMNEWRKSHSVNKVAKKLNVSLSSVLRKIKHSKLYQNSKYKRTNCLSNYSSNELKIKNSPYRQQLSKILKTWKKCRSMRQTAISLNISENKVVKMLNTSLWYKNRKQHSQQEKTYCRIWIKKIWSVGHKGGQCSICGNTDIFSMEFHHVSKNKEATISDIIQKRRTYNIEDLKKELKKCQLLCRNCHQELHHPNPQNIKYKNILFKINGYYKCSKCGYHKNSACLEFHHTDPKLKTIEMGRLCREGVAMGTINKHKEEIKNCKLLCCNCHSLEQINIGKFNKIKLHIEIGIRLINTSYPIMW